jgi:spore maturation protein CgeB
VRISIFGLTISSSWGNGHATPYRALLRALHALGHEITFYEKDVPYYAQHRDFECSDSCTLVLYSDYEDIRSEALKNAAEADIVLTASYCPEGARISDDLLQLNGPVHVFYDLDTPITLSKWQRGEDVYYIRPEQLPHFDLVLSFTGGRILDELQRRYGARLVRPLYGCVDPDIYRRAPSRPDFASDLSYMGTYAADRQQKLQELFLTPAQTLLDNQFLLAGAMYPWDLPISSNVSRLAHVSPYDHPALYSSSNWTLNITRGDMAAWGHCPSGRFFEAAACRCPVLTDNWEGLDTFFQLEGRHRELMVVQNASDVITAFSLEVAERDAIARRARERTLDEHTGMARAQQFLRACEDTFSNIPTPLTNHRTEIANQKSPEFA